MSKLNVEPVESQLNTIDSTYVESKVTTQVVSYVTVATEDAKKFHHIA